MKNDKFEIKYPKDEIIKEQIQLIIDQSIPVKQSLWNEWKDLLFGPGFKIIFYQFYSSILGGLLTYLFLLMAVLHIATYVNHEEYLIIMLFPLFNLLYSLFAYYLEDKEIHELKQSFKYSFTYITSLQMFYMSIVSMILNTFSMSMMKLNYLLKIGMIGFSSIFIFALLSLVLYQHYQSIHRIGRLLIIWISTCLLLSQYGDGLGYLLFEIIPITIHVLVLILSFISYVLYIRKVGKHAYTY